MKTLSQIINGSEVFALLEDSKSSNEKARNLLFTDQQDDIIATTEDELPAALEKIEECRQQGLYLCGYLAYEAGYYFIDKNIKRTKKNNKEQALLHFVAFKSMQVLDRLTIDEAFSEFKNYDGIISNWYEYGHKIRRTVWREVKMPVGVGFGETLTLAFTSKEDLFVGDPITLSIKQICPYPETTLSITFDDYPEEQYWELYNANDELLFEGGTYPNETMFSRAFCLASGTYRILMGDTFGDGGGPFTITYNGNVLASGDGDHGFSKVTTFQVN